MRKIRISSLKAICLLFLIGTFANSCQKNIGDAIFNNSTAGKSKTVKAFIQGKIYDENSVALSGAKVSAGSSSTITAANGYFKINNASVDQKFAFINVEKNGYYTSSRTFVSASNDSNYVEVKLIAKSLQGKFTTSAGGSINMKNGGTIVFPKNAVAEVNGKPYTGEVNVYTCRIDPSQKDFSEKMPGDLRGIREDGSESAMISYGMLVAELEGSSGQKLQIINGQNAGITMPIPETMVANAPATIPLWWFDESKGLWVEEKAATKIGNTYVGNVAHFTFWNFDVPTKMVYFKARVVDEKNNPLSYITVRIKSDSSGAAWSKTNADGYVSGWVPKNSKLVLSALNDCEDEFFTQELITDDKDIDFGNIVLKYNSDVPQLIIQGNAVNCNNEALKNGRAYVYFDSLIYKIDIINGQYKLTTPKCSKGAPWSGTLWVNDFTASQTSEEMNITIQPGTNNMPEIVLCKNNWDNYVTVEFEGSTYSYMKGDFAVTRRGDSAVLGPLTFDSLKSSTYFGITLDEASFSSANNTMHVTNYNFYKYNNSVLEFYNYAPSANMTATITLWSADAVQGTFDGTIRKYSSSITYQDIPVKYTFGYKKL